MNNRTIFICLSVLGLASGSWASSINYAILDAGASTSNLVQATAGRSDRTALDPGPRRNRIRGSRISDSSSRTIDNKGDSTRQSPPAPSVDVQKGRPSDIPQTSRISLFPPSPAATSRSDDSAAIAAPVYHGGSSEPATPALTTGFQPLMQSSSDYGQLSTGGSLCGSPCLTGVPGSFAASASKYRLTPGGHALAGSGQTYRAVPKPVETVAMPEPDISLLLIVDLAFLAGAVTFLRSRFRDKRTT